MYALSFTSLVGPHTVKTVNMTYYLLDVKRVLDNDNIFDKEEVNGGACGSMDDRCDITVWRKEEVLKVSIHELIHGLSYDYKEDSTDILNHYKGKYDITSEKVNTYEAYTEIFAALLHSYLIARFYRMVDRSVNRYELFMANVGVEMGFSHLQASKVLTLTDKDMNKEIKAI